MRHCHPTASRCQRPFGGWDRRAAKVSTARSRCSVDAALRHNGGRGTIFCLKKFMQTKMLSGQKESRLMVGLAGVWFALCTTEKNSSRTCQVWSFARRSRGRTRTSTLPTKVQGRQNNFGSEHLARRKVEWDLHCGTAESSDEHVGTEGEEVRNAQWLARQGGAEPVCWGDVGIKGAQILSDRPQLRRPQEDAAT